MLVRDFNSCCHKLLAGVVLQPVEIGLAPDRKYSSLIFLSLGIPKLFAQHRPSRTL